MTLALEGEWLTSDERRWVMTTQTPEQTCPGCGLARRDWKGDGGRGVERSGQTYCCEGCASGAGCNCR